MLEGTANEAGPGLTNTCVSASLEIAKPGYVVKVEQETACTSSLLDFGIAYSTRIICDEGEALDAVSRL